MNPQTENQFLMPIAVVIAGLIIGGAVMFGPQNSATKKDNLAAAGAAAPTPALAAVDSSKIDVAGDPFVGNANAPLAIVYWSDYQCPFCQKFDTETLGDVVKNYVNTGKVKVVFKDFQFLGDDSITLALVGRAVWDAYPDKYFSWREVMFKNQGQEGSGYATKEYVEKYTTSVPGIDMAKILSLVEKNSAKYIESIDADKNAAVALGIKGTPGIVVGTQLISGHVAYNSFKTKIDAELK